MVCKIADIKLLLIKLRIFKQLKGYCWDDNDALVMIDDVKLLVRQMTTMMINYDMKSSMMMIEDDDLRK